MFKKARNASNKINKIRRFAWKLPLPIDKAISVMENLPFVWHRPFDRYVSLHGVCAEVGVYRGVHAREMLKRNPKISQLYLVDPYIDYSQSEFNHMALPALEEARHEARVTLGKDPRSVFVYEKSMDFANHCPQLDCLYLDGEHTHKMLLNELNAFHPKVNHVIGGHDFKLDCPGVVQAVTEFAAKNNLTAQLRVQSPDWWIYKP